MSLKKFNRKGGPGKKGATPGGKRDRVYGFKNYKVGDMVSEDDFESKFKLVADDASTHPQLSVQDYSNVKKDKTGRKYVEKLKN